MDTLTWVNSFLIGVLLLHSGLVRDVSRGLMNLLVGAFKRLPEWIQDLLKQLLRDIVVRVIVTLLLLLILYALGRAF